MPFPNPDTQFKPGVCPNPSGRGKGRLSLVTIIRQKLAEGDRAAKIAERLIKIAEESPDEKTTLAAVEQLLDRIDGKPKQTIEQTNIEGPDVSGLSAEELYRLKYGTDPEPEEQSE